MSVVINRVFRASFCLANRTLYRLDRRQAQQWGLGSIRQGDLFEIE
jgi:hypothetical protein